MGPRQTTMTTPNDSNEAPMQSVVRMPLTFGSLFAGIGGFDLGFERAGMVCQWQVEIDKYANRILEKHWPNVHREADVRECGGHNLERVDVICGGFPCQDISSSGLRRGLVGERSGLFFDAVRIIRELRPRVVVMENVADIIHRGIDRVLGELAEIGYDSEWHCIPAAYFGSPQGRDRMWIIAYPDCERCEASEELYCSRPIISRWPNLDGLVMAQYRAGHVAPRKCRVADGVSRGVDRVRCLGNAVVPQLAEWIGRQIVEAAS